ncbi:MAG: hypothetical protein R3C14_39220 [Caldilineaceae bacterium]
MLIFLRRFLVVLIGIVLVAAPTVVRDWGWRYNERNYTPPDVPDLSFAATPMPTPTPLAVKELAPINDNELRAGPVVVDFAHFSFLNPASLQPLADALADRGVGMRYWISTVDPMKLENFADFPDQSAELAAQLRDASALFVISPIFLWTEQEIAVVEHFVADGGRLLLISDPDFAGDVPSLTNMLAEPFGIVFNDDYLYDTTHNDGNFTFFFQGEATDQAANLADATIAFYGGRSISGAVAVQMRSAATTASSLRIGQSGFATVAIGGVASRNTQGRVLALSDFDVLSEVYRTRHDNQRMVDFVADFLTADQRINRVADFPNYLGKQVALAFGTTAAINAELLHQGAQLQQRLESSGRTLALTNSNVLTNSVTIAERSAATITDLIYLADYTTARAQTTLLADLGIDLVTEVVTSTVTPTEATTAAKPTPAVTATKTATPQANATPSVAATGEITTTVAATHTTAVTATATLTTAPAITATATVTASAPVTPTAPKPTVTITNYLVTATGLRLLADETVLVVQTRGADGAFVLAVLGADSRGIDAGVKRLLDNDFTDCVLGDLLTFCSLPGTGGAASSQSSGSAGKASESGTSEPSPKQEPTPAPSGGRIGILLVDDNRAAGQNEAGEADSYLQALIAAGYSVDLWDAASQGAPTVADLAKYAWVIWSNGGYNEGKMLAEDMDIIFNYVREAGKVTISSRFPLPGIEEPSTVRDVAIDDTIPTLVQELPDEPIALAAEQIAANLTPLAADASGGQVVLRRGPASDDAAAPLLVVLTDTSATTSTAQVMIVGVAINGLPQEVSNTLVNNMATWMLGE